MHSLTVIGLLVASVLALGYAQGPVGHHPVIPISNKEDKLKLRFKVSGRSLPDKDNLSTIDPYVIIKVSENDSPSETELGKTETVSGNKNPDWSETFTFDFDRKRRQRWHFLVYDHDLLRDDKAGETWVTVSDYVDNNQYLQVNLKKGYLIIQKV